MHPFFLPKDMIAIGTTPLLGYVVTSNTIRLHHPSKLEQLQVIFEPVTEDYNE